LNDPTPNVLAYLDWLRPAGVITSMAELKEWQAGRCAMCGEVPKKLFLDHCHEGGWPRGYLCIGCNNREGRDRVLGRNDSAWSTYRRNPPAVLYGVRVLAEGGSRLPRVKRTKEQISAMKRRGWQAGIGRLTPEELSTIGRRGAAGFLSNTTQEQRKTFAQKAGLQGGPARAAKLTPDRRSEIGRRAAAVAVAKMTTEDRRAAALKGIETRRRNQAAREEATS
jgi:Recombination endonuclease VII